jgi:hypothetical protein
MTPKKMEKTDDTDCVLASNFMLLQLLFGREKAETSDVRPTKGN